MTSHVHPTRRRFALGAIAAAGFGMTGVTVRAQAYPARPVKIIVPFAAGGSADVYGRFLAQRLADAMGGNFIVEDRPGGGSIIGTDAVAQAAPDGYTLLLMSNTHTVNESLIPNKPFVLMRDFVPVAPINQSDLVLVVRDKLPVRDLADLLQQAKAKPDGMTYASSGPGTPYHMAGELLKAMAGVSIIHVPYKGSSGARTDVIGGQVDMMFDAITTMAPHIASGRVRAIGTSGTERSPVLPNVPTIAQAGVPGYESGIWLGLIAPKGVPEPILQSLNAAIGKIVSEPATRSSWAAQGATAMTMSTREFEAYLKQDIDKWAGIVKVSGAKAGQ
jgi:tripartite-type tricarboxylate transporter receptor subunit TctC